MRKLASLCIPCALLLACADRVEAQAEKSRTFCDKADPKNKCAPPATDCLCVDDTLEVTFDGQTDSVLEVKAAGEKVPVTVMMDTKDAGVQGWSYGVTHDDTILTLNSVTIDGTDAKAKFNSGFNATSMENIQACTDPADAKCTNRKDGGGFISAVVLALTEQAELDVKRNSLSIAQYTAAKVPSAAGSLIAVTDRLAKKNSPPTAINITIVGKSRAPVTIIDGLLTGGGVVPEDCDNKVDDDGDTKVDCADPDCTGDPACPPTKEDCDNKVDDDGDTKVDCADPDCTGDPACPPTKEDCDNKVDDDGDTKVDCDDPDCTGDPACPPTKCDNWAYYFGPAATTTTLAIGAGNNYVISMRNASASLGFQLGVKATKAGAATNWEFSGTLGADANRLIELIISDDKANSQTPVTPNKATSDTGDVSTIERGAAISGFSKDDFFAFDTKPGVGGPGFTVGYVTDLQGTAGHKVPATKDTTPCPVNEILRVNLGGVVEPQISRGDADGNEKINVVDAILIIQIDVGNLPARFDCQKILDANDDGTVTVTDAIPVLKYVFEKGANLPAPFRSCGKDPTADALPCTESNCQ